MNSDLLRNIEPAKILCIPLGFLCTWMIVSLAMKKIFSLIIFYLSIVGYNFQEREVYSVSFSYIDIMWDTAHASFQLYQCFSDSGLGL